MPGSKNQSISAQKQSNAQRNSTAAMIVQSQQTAGQQTTSTWQPTVATTMTAHQTELERLKKELGEIKKPSVLMTQQFDEKAYERNISANKRQKKSNNYKSRLFQKKCNASRLEEAEYSYAMQRESSIKFATAQGNGGDDQAALLAAFFGEEATENAQMVSDYQDQGKRSEVLVKCLQKFVKTDLSQIDVRDDATLVEHAGFLEQLSEQTQAMKEMIAESDFGGSSDTEENRQYREKFDVIYETVSPVLNYYRIKKQIMKHPYYQNHYNTEISMHYSGYDSAEKRELSFLLWQAQVCLEKLNVSAQTGSVITLKDRETEERSNHQMLQNYLLERAKKSVASEKIPQELKNDDVKYHDEIRKQVEYLEWKYKDRFLLLSPGQIIQHFDSIQKDFAPLQEMFADMEIRRKTTAVFGNTEENRILRRKLAYYTGVWQVEQKMYQELAKEPDMSYAQYRRKMAEYASDLNAADIQDSMQSAHMIDLTKEKKDYPGKQPAGQKLSRAKAYHDYLKRREFIADTSTKGIVLPQSQSPEVTEQKIKELSSVSQNLKNLIQKDLFMGVEEKKDRFMNVYSVYQAELEHYIDQKRSLCKNPMPAGTILSEGEKKEILDELKNGEYKEVFTGYEEYLKWKSAKKSVHLSEEKLLNHMQNVEEQPQELPQEIDDGLSEEQIAGIHAIDQWMFRNMVHDGLTGSTQERYVCELMKRPMRERLLSYYIVEKGQYKNPNAATTVCSQAGYIPNLEAFKSCMVATKFKFWRRRNGGQIYWNKLDLAFGYASQNRNMVHTFSLASQEEEKLKKSQNLQPLQKKALERQEKYKEFLQYASDYREFLEKCSGKPDAKKQYLSTQKQAFVKLIQTSLRELVELDKEFPKAKLRNADEQFSPEKEEEQTRTDIAFETAEKIADPVGTIFSNGQWISTESDISAFINWGIGETGLARLNLASGILGTVSGLAAVVDFVVKCREYSKNKGDMEDSEKHWARVELVDSGLGVVSTLGTNIALASAAKTYANVYNEIETSALTTGISHGARVLTVVSSGIQIARSCAELSQVSDGMNKLASAKSMFLHKRMAKPDQSKSVKEKRQEEYELGIMKLAGRQLLIKKQKAWVDLVSSGSVLLGSFAGWTTFGIAEPIADLFSMTLSICGSIHEYFQIQKRNEEFVDDYLKVTDALKLLGLDIENKTYRKQVRKELLAKFGFSGTASFFAHIAKRYAQTLYQNLFFSTNGEPLTNAEYEKDKDTYAPYVTLVESLGLRVKYPEAAGGTPHPSENAILEKLS